jgi:hypothetical protein
MEQWKGIRRIIALGVTLMVLGGSNYAELPILSWLSSSTPPKQLKTLKPIFILTVIVSGRKKWSSG